MPSFDSQKNPSLPLILSILISQDMFNNNEVPFTPVSSLTIPLLIIKTPYNYVPIFILNLLTVFLGKYATVFRWQSDCLPLQSGHEYPDLNTLRQILRQSQYSASPEKNLPQQVSASTLFDPPIPSGKNNTLDTPLFPNGLAVNILLSAPLEDSESTSAFYAVRLFRIKYLYGILIPIVGILLYIFLYPRISAKATECNDP